MNKFKTFAYCLAIGILLYLLWQKSCNSNPVVPDNKYKDTLQWLRDTLELNRAHESVLQETVEAAEKHILELGDQSDNAERKLAKANKEVNYWIGKVKGGWADSVSYAVRPYPCDSLVNACIDAQLRCYDVIQLKDSTIMWYQGEVGSYKLITQSLIHDTVLYAGQVKTLENKVNALKASSLPFRTLSFGADVASTYKAFSFVMATGAYHDIKGNSFEAGGGLQLNGEPIFKLGWKKDFLKFKKRK